jgi:REP element-mobilizing transposase RayT
LPHPTARVDTRRRFIREDYDAFVTLMAEASLRAPMRILSYCVMPNHFHIARWPHEDGDVSRWMHWLMTTHVRRDLRHYESSGHVWQGRFNAFPTEEDEHLLTVLRFSLEGSDGPFGLRDGAPEEGVGRIGGERGAE